MCGAYSPCRPFGLPFLATFHGIPTPPCALHKPHKRFTNACRATHSLLVVHIDQVDPSVSPSSSPPSQAPPHPHVHHTTITFIPLMLVAQPIARARRTSAM